MQKTALYTLAAVALCAATANAHPWAPSEQPEKQLVLQLKDGSVKSFDYTPTLKMTYSVAEGDDILTLTDGDIAWQTRLDDIDALNLNPIMADGIYLNITEAEVAIGDTFRIIATVMPDDATDKTVIWQSLDPSVATVSNDGLVTALSFGETLITATCGNLVGICFVSIGMKTDIHTLITDREPLTVAAAAGAIIIRGKEADEAVTVFDTAGVMVYLGTDSRIPISTPGAYIVAARGKTFKVIL